MGTPETSREPCPDRILDDLGGAFAMGAIGGSAYHFIKGTINTPRGEKLLGGFQSMRMNAPRTGGGFAAWGGLFSTFDCTMVYLRQKEDPWNSIAAGAATGGILQMRQGVRAAGKSAAIGAVLLGLIEGAGIMLNRVMSPLPPGMMEEEGPVVGFVPPQGGVVYGRSEEGVVKEGGGGGWFGGWFGGGSGSGKEEKTGTGIGTGGGGSETKVLESYDTPTPMPSFEFK